MNVEGIEKFLIEFKRETYGNRDVVTVGKANGVSANQAVHWVDEEKGKFNMIFQFEATNLWEKPLGSLNVSAYKRNGLFLENDDKPRIISTWGNDKEYWRDYATAFATVYMLMMGTPFIYQGQEIGMINVRFPSITDYPDVAARNFYNLELAKGIKHNELMEIIYMTGRDNARTPMQWDDSLNAGFSTAEQIIKDNDVFIYGIYDLILSNHKQIYGYTRTSNTKRAYVLTNLTDRVAEFTLYQGLSSSQLVLTNLLEPIPEHKDEKSFKFHPYGIRVYVIDYHQEELHHLEEKKHTIDQSENIQSTLSIESKEKDELTKRQQVALEKFEEISHNSLHQTEQSQKDIISISTETTAKALSEIQTPKHKSTSEIIDQEKIISSNSSKIDLENESIHKKRERQRSLILNLENILSVVQSYPGSFDQHRRSFSTIISQTSRKSSFISHHPSNEDDDEKKTITHEIEDKSIDLNGKDIDYSVLYNETVEDFSFTNARKPA
ncbi:unnamed protein product [Rotaria sordida]|uniref:Glycosyl hydrolase family 13 catalytic domain-containing protein n=1 Tax=Rotaria sordida TaxID=392033 RepID=A0A815KBX6_9BILA|nr:unnamed protein product [Rotaria sordida]CAF1393974.1 unnamed protein product [Rotaria sordida]CAF3800785.1 unnamed protein product [Rotaria sordida]CAF3873374.1 unnamed protein product [Rotaria sordida]